MLKRSIIAAAICVAIAGPASTADIKLPPQMSWTAYDAGSSGFNMAVAIGQMLKNKHGTDIRVLPAGNDVARLAPLRSGKSQVSAMGIGTYFAQEGVFEFGVKEWGPQPLRVLLSSNSCNAISLGVAKDTGVKEIKDLKGKRIGIVIGSPALNQNAYAIIAFGGLTVKDVKLVEFSSYGAMWKGMVNNEVDAAIASNISGQVREVEVSPRGVVYPPTPKADTAGWARLNKIGPYYSPHLATCGVGGMTKDNPIELPNYPYPIVMAYADQPDSLIYGVTKAMIANYDDYKDAAPGADGFELKRQNFAWAVPYHSGAVQAFKEAGIWTEAMEKHNAGLIKRQDVLGGAWKAYVATNPADDKFYDGWLKARAAALAKADLPVIFE